MNKSFYYLIESFLRSIMVLSIELIKNDEIIFKEFFSYIKTIINIFENLDKKYNLYSKEILNIKILIKIEESYKSSFKFLKINYEKIIKNLLKQSKSKYEKDDNYMKLL